VAVCFGVIDLSLRRNTLLKPTVFLALVLVIGALVGCQSQPQEAAQIQQLQQELASLEARLDQLAPGAEVNDLNTRMAALEQKLAMPEAPPAPGGEAPGVADLAARVEALEAHLEAVETSPGQESEQGQAFQVATTLYLLDTAGFHEIDESINQENTIQPEFPGTVQRARRMVALTAWPEELHENAMGLGDTLDAFAAALADDDLEAAKPLATQVHDQQHDLSHAAGDWLSEHGLVAHEESHD
jgi:hypothetical protein